MRSVDEHFRRIKLAECHEYSWSAMSSTVLSRLVLRRWVAANPFIVHASAWLMSKSLILVLSRLFLFAPRVIHMSSMSA